jgi:septal ring factor EnvC (AmiA/AmiB activator)
MSFATMNRCLLLLALICFLTAPPGLAEGRKVKTLVDYKAELSLSDTQIKEIGDALKNFQTTITEQRKLLTQFEGEYSKLVSDHAPLEQVKQKLRQLTDVNFNLRYADVLTSRKVEGILSTDQLTRWREIQTKVRSAPKPKPTP